jgi:hypothetical protein
MRRTLALLTTIAFALSLAGAADAASCKDAKGKFIKCPAAAAAPAATPAAAKPAATPAAKPAATAAAKPAATQVATGGSPNCKKGKPCGHSCIAMDKVCHK